VPGGTFAPPATPSFLASIRAGRAEVWLLLADRSSLGRPTREQQFAEELRRRYPEVFRDASSLLLTMREIKSEAELALIQRAVDVTVEAQKAAMASRPQRSRTRSRPPWLSRFGTSAPAAGHSPRLSPPAGTQPRFTTRPTTIGSSGTGCSSPTSAPKSRATSGDVTRTYPADGTFSAEQRAIYDAVLAAQSESMELMRPGHQFIEAHTAAVAAIGRELLKLGPVTKNAPEQVKLYFLHGVDHQLGLQTHDVFDRVRAFEPGMVVTNEPGVYVRKDDILASDVFAKLTASEQASVRAAVDRHDGIGVRIEDDVLITAGQPRVLSAGAPRSPKEIEALMAR
jgi:Xaa-Pro aminopeptidase